MQIMFGKNDAEYENKKVDIIKINWLREPKRFMVYIWKKGCSWQLQKAFKENSNLNYLLLSAEGNSN